MKCLVALLVAVAACSSSPAQMPDAAIEPDAAPPDGPSLVPDPTRSSLTTDRDIALVGTEPVTVNVIVRDPTGIPIVNVDVQLVAGAGGTVSPPSRTDDSGHTSATWTSTVAGPQDITLIVHGTTLATHTVTFLSAPATRLAFQQGPTDVVAGAWITPGIEVVTTDDDGNLIPLGSGTVQLEISTNPASGHLYGSQFGPVSAGIATFPHAMISKPGAGYVLRAHMTGLADAYSTTFDVFAGDPDDVYSTLTISPGSLEANGTETATVTLDVMNAYGIPISGANVMLAVSGSNNTVVPASGTTDAHGTLTAALSSTTAEVKTVTATIGALTLTDSVEFDPPSLPPVPGSSGD
jgi:adhesin/invasin